MSSSPSPNGIITLTTDFGASDHFVGTMKGVILSIAPRARVVDISHAIQPFNIAEAAFEIAQAWTYFPKGTIHVCVVDPGVGSERMPILVEAGGHYFIGPDNGIFSLIFTAAKHKVRHIANPKLMRPSISRTFHGRDVFAPAAAHLAMKTPPVRFGKPVADPHRLLTLVPNKMAGQSWHGTVLKVDRFGNLITNFHEHQFPDVKTMPIEVRIGRQSVRRFALTYSDTEGGDLFVIVGSSGYLEIAVNQASAAERLKVAAGAPVTLEFA